MAFENIPPVPKKQELLDIAFQAAEKKAKTRRSQLKRKTRLEKSISLESLKVNTVASTLIRQLERVLTVFPSLNRLDPFYYDLVVTTIDYVDVKQSLGALQWSVKRIKILASEYNKKIRACRQLTEMNRHRQAFYGRISSIIKQIDRNLRVLEQTRKVFRKYPTVKTGRFTVVLAGYPNVGKTTLLKALTKSEPEIAPYPFTTKRLMIGFMDKIQIIDTPGLLDRPLSERNPIERQSILALHHLADIVIFMFDPTEQCGYPMKKQEALLKELKKDFKNVKTVANKADMSEKKVRGAISISAKEEKGIEKIRKLISASAAQPK